MARPLRINLAGAWYHVTARGNERKDIFRDPADREQFVRRMSEMVERFRVGLHGYVLMGNHYHLLVEPEEENLSRAMQWLNLSYSQWFNRRHQRSGHLLQGRFQSVLVDWQQWGLELSRYVHLNPGRHLLDKRSRKRNQSGVGQGVSAEVVRARVESLRAYRWSSYRAYIGLEPVPVWLQCEGVLGLIKGRRGEQCRQYQDYVEGGVREGVGVSVWAHLKGQTVLGDEEFVEKLQSALEGDEREQAGLKRLRRRPRWAEAVEVVERMKGEGWEQFRERRGDWGRDLVLWLGRKACGMKLKELAEAAGVRHYASVGTALRYLEHRSAKNPFLAQLMTQAKGKLEKNNK